MKLHFFFVTLGLLVLSQVTLCQSEQNLIHIGERFTITSEILKQEREIFISLPPGYDNSEHRYPVHYVLDGEITFESYCGLVHIMSLAGQIPEAIIIGLPNINRKFDLNPNENARRFLDFMVKELATFIDREYRTDGQKVITGYSMAGNFVIYAFLNEHGFFDSYISGSPYRLDLYKDNDLTIDIKDTHTNRAIFTSMGNEDRPKQLETFKEFCTLLDLKAIDQLDFKHIVENNRNHDNNIIPNWLSGLEFIYRNWKSSE